MFYNRAV